MTEDELQKLRIELASKLWLEMARNDIRHMGIDHAIERSGDSRGLADTSFLMVDTFIDRLKREHGVAEGGCDSPVGGPAPDPPEESVLHQAAEHEFSLNDGDFRIYHDPETRMWVACTSSNGHIAHWGGCRFLAPNGRLYNSILPPGDSNLPRTCWEPINAPFSRVYAGPKCLFPTALKAARAAWTFQQGKYPGEMAEAEGVSASESKACPASSATEAEIDGLGDEIIYVSMRDGWRIVRCGGWGKAAGRWVIRYDPGAEDLLYIDTNGKVLKEYAGNLPPGGCYFLSFSAAAAALRKHLTCSQPESPAKPAAPAF